MKIALLADIHGNNVALEAVLDHAQAEGVEKYILLGDYITDCSQPNEVLKTIQSLDGWKIRGNREIMIMGALENEQIDWEAHDQMRSLIWTRDRLNKEGISFIETLKDTVTIPIDGFGSIKVVHGSPDKADELLKHDRIERVEEVLDQLHEDVLICGHTHIPWHFEHEGKVLINPGSVGIAFNDRVCAEYAIIEIQGDQLKVIHHKVPYEYRRLELTFSESGLLKRSPVWAPLVLQSLADGTNRNIEFIESVIDLMKRKNLTCNNFFPNEVWSEAYVNWKRK